MSHRPVDLLIADVIESIEKIERYIAGLDQAAFLRDGARKGHRRASMGNHVLSRALLGRCGARRMIST